MIAMTVGAALPTAALFTCGAWHRERGLDEDAQLGLLKERAPHQYCGCVRSQQKLLFPHGPTVAFLERGYSVGAR